jgi:hypothetical protein
MGGANGNMTGDLAARVARLERANRRLMGGVVMLALGSACIVAIGVAAPAPKSIEAEQFIVRGPDGKLRGWVGLNENGWSGFAFMDPTGTRRASLAIQGDKDVTLQLNDSRERNRVVLGVKPNDSASLHTYGGREVAVGSNADGESGIFILGRDKKPMAGIGVSAQGETKAFP